MIQEIEEGEPQNPGAIQRAEGKAAEDAHGPAEKSQQQGGAMPFHPPFVRQEGHTHLQHGDGRCKGRRQDGHKEDGGGKGAQKRQPFAHLVENVGQRLKDQSRTGARLQAGGKHGRHHGKAGDEGKSQVAHGRSHTGNKEVFLFLDVRRIG